MNITATKGHRRRDFTKENTPSGHPGDHGGKMRQLETNELIDVSGGYDPTSPGTTWWEGPYPNGPFITDEALKRMLEWGTPLGP